MSAVRRSNERGFADHGWLKSFHTFSFADYYDPRYVEFGVLRVINEDRVKGGAGFPTHSHKNMEIISYVLSGGLAHSDSMGHGSTIRPGDVQLMSSGSGVTHSEFNASATKTVHFIQIWIRPNVMNVAPSYEEKRFSSDERRGKLRLIVSPDGNAASLTIHQDARLYSGLFEHDEAVVLPIQRGRCAYVHVARGAVDANGIALSDGDGLRLIEEQELRIENGRGGEVLVFDLPAVEAASVER